MMKRKLYNSIHFTVWVMVMSVCSACSSFVEVEPPKSQLLTKQVFEEISTVEAALAGVYTQLRQGYGSLFLGERMGMSFYLAHYTDELVSYNNTHQQSFGPNFYNHLVYADSQDLYYMWTAAYNQIYNVNVIIEGLQAAPNLPAAKSASLRGKRFLSVR